MVLASSTLVANCSGTCLHKVAVFAGTLVVKGGAVAVPQAVVVAQGCATVILVVDHAPVVFACTLAHPKNVISSPGCMAVMMMEICDITPITSSPPTLYCKISAKCLCMDYS